MSNVAHETAAVARPQVDTLARRLLVLRSEIDAILAGLASTHVAVVGEEPDRVDEPGEEPVMMSAMQTTDESAAAVAPEACAVDGQRAEKAWYIASTPAPDDLTLIRGIDDQLCDELSALGIVAYAQIARWSARDVADVEQALGLRRVICKENWIEQAAMLAAGKLTTYASRAADYPLAYEAGAAPEAEQSSEADVFMLERVGRVPAPAADRPANEQRPPTQAPRAAPQPRIHIEVVPSLEPYRGIPRLGSAARKRAVAGQRPRIALGLKVAACLVALVVAGLVMVGRDAWGSAHQAIRKKAALPLQLHGPAKGNHFELKYAFR
jgi:predicted flap endonuclease-1-like 5' DNA nuclease